MKKNHLFTLVAAVIFSGASLAFGTTASYESVVEGDTPIAFWPLNETNGTTIHDIVSTNNGTVGGSGSALGIHGITFTNNSTDLAFSNSTSSYISIPYNAAMNTANFSCEMWLNPSSNASSASSGEAPFGFSNGNLQGWTWEFQGSTTVIGFWLPCSTSSTWAGNNCSCPIFKSAWVYYVATFDGAHTLLYTNGVLATTYAQSGHLLEASANKMYIGAYNGPAREFPGDFENVAVYSSVLTASQITNHYYYGTNYSAPAGTAPSITTQPASQTNNVGQTATIIVSANGSSPLSYQWQVQSNGIYANLSAGGQFSGVTNATLSISSLVTNNATNYEVIVTNLYGSVTSAPATLTVSTNAVGPSGQTPYQTIVMADAPVSFWPLNETNGTVIHDIAGTNNGTAINTTGLTLGGPGILYSNGVITDKAIYFTNTSSGYISIPYSSDLNTTPFSVEVWLNMPTFPATGASANMNALSFNAGSSAYGWTWNISSANGSNPGMYGWLGKNAGWTSVNTGTALQGQWSYYAMTYNGTVFSVYTNGVLAGSQSSTYYMVNAGTPLYLGAYNDNGSPGSPDGARYYRGGMENVAAYDYTLTSSQIGTHYFYGTNSSAIFIITPPASQTNYVGLTATLSVDASGLPPLIYQWQAGTAGSGGPYTNLTAGGQFSAVTNATLTISNLVLTNAADYVVVVSNSYGAVTSSPATLTVLNDTAPSIVTQPASQTNFAGLTTTFNVNATGYPPLAYQWRAGLTGSGGPYTNLVAGGQNSSVTNASLSITSVTTNNAADYVVVVSDSFGSVTSAPATLTVTSNNMSGAPVKIMCLGDSITHIDTCYWRVDLATELVNAGYNFLMVGRSQGTLGPVNQRHHEGYEGYTTSDIINIIPGAMAANVPDICMVHIGANDLSGDAPNPTADHLAAIIKDLQASNANMTIVVSQIIPCQHCGQINEYDYLIPQICQRLQTPTSHVVVVDVFTGFIENVMFDGGVGPHPNATGGQFMCDRYFPVITSILNGVIPVSAPLPPPWPGPPGYILCSFANNGAYQVNFPTPVNVAYGANGHYYFASNVSGHYSFNNDVGDPDPGFEKYGFVQQNGPAFASSSKVSNHAVQMQLTGVTNQSYTLQVATDLQSLNLQGSILGTNSNVPPGAFPIGPTNWVSVASTNTTTNTSFVLTDPNATNKMAVYRVFVGP